jgi:hypothetical protein
MGRQQAGPSRRHGEEDAMASAADSDDARQREVAEHTRQAGGDAPSAGSLDEREAVAQDEDDLFDDQQDDEGGDAQRDG